MHLHSPLLRPPREGHEEKPMCGINGRTRYAKQFTHPTCEGVDLVVGRPVHKIAQFGEQAFRYGRLERVECVAIVRVASKYRVKRIGSIRLDGIDSQLPGSRVLTSTCLRISSVIKYDWEEGGSAQPCSRRRRFLPPRIGPSSFSSFLAPSSKPRRLSG